MTPKAGARARTATPAPTLISKIVAAGALALGLAAGAAGAASASTIHHPWYCSKADLGNIRTTISNKSYLCTPRHGHRPVWVLIHERVEN